MKPCFSYRGEGHSGRAPADGVPCSANVLRPSASPFISLRKAPHRRERYAEQSLISDTPRTCPGAQGIGCSPQRNQGGGRRPGDIRGGEYPVICAHALKSALNKSAPNKNNSAKKN